MVVPAVKARILDDLERLPPDLQRRAADLIRGLVAEVAPEPPDLGEGTGSELRPKGASPKEVLRFFGTLDAESAREMEEAIEESCEQIAPDAG